MSSGEIVTFNLAAGRPGPVFSGITAQEAVIAAHAQSLGDFNTWEYEERYGDRVEHGRATVRCGDFTALCDEHAHDEPIAV